MKKEVIEIEVQTGDSVQDINKVTDSIEDLGKEGKKATKGIENSSKKATKGLKGMSKGLKGVKKGFKGVGLAIKAAGIGILIGLFVALKDILGKNQKVMDAFSSVMTTISLVFNAVTDAVSDAFSSVSKMTGGFDAAKKVVMGLINIGLAPLKIAFFALKAGLISLQLSWEKSFLGKRRPEKIAELSKALLDVGEDLKAVGRGVIQSGKDIVNNFKEAITEVSALATTVVDNVKKVSIKNLKAMADAMVALKNQAILAKVINQGLIEDFDRQAELQRQIRDDVNKSVEERIAANNKLKKILEDQEKAMLKNADLVIEAAKNELALNNNVENQAALIEALNEKKAILAQIEGKRSEQLVNQTALTNEQLALEQTLTDRQALRNQAQRDFEAENIENEALRLKRQLENLEIDKELEEIRLQDVIDNTKIGTQARVDAEQDLFDSKVAFANKTSVLIKKSAKEEIRIAEALENLKLSIINKSSQAVIAIVGRNSKIGKALAVATAIWNTKEAITKTLAKTPYPFNIPAAIATGIFGFAQVKDILSTANPSGGGGGSSVSVPSISAPATALAPSFNIAGNGGTNQLASAIGGQSQEPIQAFVVSNDVTTAQSLDRNIVESASLG